MLAVARAVGQAVAPAPSTELDSNVLFSDTARNQLIECTKSGSDPCGMWGRQMNVAFWISNCLPMLVGKSELHRSPIALSVSFGWAGRTSESDVNKRPWTTFWMPAVEGSSAY